jgi:hypothetical protein
MLTRLVWPCCLLLLLLTAGCGSGSPSVRVWGTVSYQGQPVKEGQIIFFPTEGTESPSAGGMIHDGKYDIPKDKGPYAGGTYRVQITALGANKTYSPNVSGAGPMVSVREQLIPPRYNQQSTLRVAISADPAQNQHDFDLK